MQHVLCCYVIDMLRHSYIHRHIHVTRQYSLTIYILSTHYIHTYTRAVTVIAVDVLVMDSRCVDGYLFPLVSSYVLYEPVLSASP